MHAYPWPDQERVKIARTTEKNALEHGKLTMSESPVANTDSENC